MEAHVVKGCFIKGTCSKAVFGHKTPFGPILADATHIPAIIFYFWWILRIYYTYKFFLRTYMNNFYKGELLI